MSNKTKKPIHDDWKADVNDYSFFDQLWDDWAPVYETIPVDPADYQEWLDDDNNTTDKPEATVNTYDPLNDEGVSNEIRNSITSFRSWGQGPVLAAMKGLDIFQINNQADADSVINWLDENYDSIFEGDYDFADIPELPENTYEAKEMDLTYTPKYSKESKVLRHAYGGYKDKVNSSPSFDFSAFTTLSSTNSLYEL